MARQDLGFVVRRECELRERRVERASYDGMGSRFDRLGLRYDGQMSKFPGIKAVEVLGRGCDVPKTQSSSCRAKHSGQTLESKEIILQITEVSGKCVVL
jgi:hypothetical protein